MKQGAIGIVGGMGSLAANHFLGRLTAAFPAHKEWDRPRIVLDNRCQMPSRVRALLYNERVEELVEGLSDSISGLANFGCTDIVLCCNTSHVFLPQALPVARRKAQGAAFTVHHILKLLGECLQRDGVRQVSLLATEGTILSRVYEDTLSEYGVTVCCEGESAFSELRFLIEAAKQDLITPEALDRFIALCNRQPCENVVLGCTEFPILYSALGGRVLELTHHIHDPLSATIDRLCQVYGEEE